MERSLDVWSLSIIVTLAHSFFVLLLLLLKKEYQRPGGVWLLLLLLTLFWLQLEFLAIRWPYDAGFSLFYGSRFGSWMLVGPLFFFYIQSITGSTAGKTWVWLLPLLIVTLLLPLLLSDFLTYRQVHYGMLTPFDKRPDEINGIQYFYSGIFIFQFVYLFYFLIRSNHSINGYYQSLKNTRSDIAIAKVRWLQILWVGMVLVWVFATLFLLLLFFTDVYRRHLDYLYVLPTSLLIYLVSYQLAGVNWEKPTVVLKYEKSGLKQSEIAHYRERIHHVIRENQLYLRKGLKLQDLADQIDLSTHQLSQLINQHLHTTFFDLINKYRIEEAKERIQNHPEYTLLQIAYDSGFNNKTSFVNAFKRFEKTTPSSFMKRSA